MPPKPTRITVFEPDPFDARVLRPRTIDYDSGVSIANCGYSSPAEWGNVLDAGIERGLRALTHFLDDHDTEAR